MGFFATVGSSVLLFFLVFGMSATVEIRQLRKQLKNSTALLIGVSLQFIILPFVGFLVVKMFRLPAVLGITLLVVTSSPGGSYSNWWCSMFNAELALSVTMTAISTLLSTVMLPANLILYTKWTYSSAVVKSLDWYALFTSLVVVIGGISCGLYSSARAARRGKSARFHRTANQLGNLAGLALVTLSLSVSSSDDTSAIWQQDARFYVGVAMPAVIGLGIATYLATKLELEKPERVAVAVEGCYQNTGIATSVALNMFSGGELATAIGVPLYYGIVEAVMLAIFCLVCWKRGWTKAPKDENICVVIFNSYEVDDSDRNEQELAFEVVLGASDSRNPPNDLIFCQADDGAYIVDEESLGHIAKKDRSVLKTDDPTEYSDSCSDEHDNSRQEAFVAPSSPTESCSSIESALQGNPEFPPSLTSQPKSRISNTIASIRARATGYRKAPLPEPTLDDELRIPATVDDQGDDELPSSSSNAASYLRMQGKSRSRPPVTDPLSVEGKTID